MSDVFDNLEHEVAVGEQADAEAYLRSALEIVVNAKPMPLSSSVRIEREELVELLEGALARLPEEIKQARWLLKEREDYLVETRRKAEGIMEEARVQTERMVQRTEVVRQANHVSQRILDDANEDARRLRHEAEDYADKKLASFEIVLDRTLKTVQAGREKLSVSPIPAVEIGDQGDTTLAAEGAGAEADDSEGFFDQDLA